MLEIKYANLILIYRHSICFFIAYSVFYFFQIIVDVGIKIQYCFIYVDDIA